MELSLDLGIKLGYCIRKDDGNYTHGVFKLKGGDRKYKSFKDALKFFEEAFGKIDKIYFENVSFQSYTYSSHSWGGMKSILLAFCEEKKIDCMGFEVSTIKKEFTGKGNSSKMGMIHYAEKWMGKNISDDNEADAIAVMYTARRGIK